MKQDKNIQEWLAAKHTLEAALKAPSCENRLGHIIALNAVNSGLAAALEAYTTHPAHDDWYKIYMPIRAESRTHDVSN